MSPIIQPPPVVLAAWALTGATVTPLGSGLINHTWLVADGGRTYVLQQLHPVFPAAINNDIQTVTQHLRARGLAAPELLPTRTGALWLEDEGQVFRLMTHIAGTSLDRLTEPAQAREAGALLGRFHRALDDFLEPFHSRRPGVHDTARHLAALQTALTTHRDHPQFEVVQPLGERILALAAALPPLPAVPDRVVHGDPKINNLLFDPAGRALCFIDLDTLGRMPLPLELGDAFRSWCNPRGEDDQYGGFSLPLFEAAIAGYAGEAHGWITPAEWQAIVPATLTIYVELAARFCADALNESYFGWDARRFATRSAHNQVRAASQLTAADQLATVAAEADAIVVRAFTPGR